uniref:Uncharacterized protein n=1 Tax=Vespula pensylvanica TaxID=30213 RepID=A0A834UAL2_VESPE|nr:hypothetical protein H0235_008253 [Vespula pensylvanica]
MTVILESSTKLLLGSRPCAATVGYPSAIAIAAAAAPAAAAAAATVATATASGASPTSTFQGLKPTKPMLVEKKDGGIEKGGRQVGWWQGRWGTMLWGMKGVSVGKGRKTKRGN